MIKLEYYKILIGQGACLDISSYALGSAYASQMYNAMLKEVIDVAGDIRSKDFSNINKFLKEKIHKYGESKTPQN